MRKILTIPAFVFLLNGCAVPLNDNRPYIVSGEPNKIGACILMELEGADPDAYGPGKVIYREVSAKNRVDIIYPLYGLYGPQDTIISYSITGLTGGQASVRVEAFDTAPVKAQALKALSACSG